MDLDERLELSAPPTTRKTEALRADILEMVASTEEKQHRRRRLGLTSRGAGGRADRERWDHGGRRERYLPRALQLDSW
ncbi:MAG: hypothetical protein R2722_07075 [Tessaracoccus sp.]